MPYEPKLDWLDVVDPDNPPPGAERVTAAALVRMETGIDEATDVAEEALDRVVAVERPASFNLAVAFSEAEADSIISAYPGSYVIIADASPPPPQPAVPVVGAPVEGDGTLDYQFPDVTVDVNGNPITLDPVAPYDIQYGLVTPPTATPVGLPSSEAHLTGRPNGQVTYARFRARSSLGVVGQWSTIVAGTPEGAADLDPPPAPASITVNPTAVPGELLVDWPDVMDGAVPADSYGYRLSTDAGATWSGWTSTGTTSGVLLTGLPAVLHRVQASALDASGNRSLVNPTDDDTPLAAGGGGFDWSTVGTLSFRWDPATEGLADGAPIDQLTDRSGLARHALKLADGSRPVLAANAFGPGLHAARFNGVNSILQTAAFGAPLAQPNLIGVVVDASRGINTSGARTFIAGRDGTAHNLSLNATGQATINAGGTARSGGATGLAVPVIIIGYFDGALSRLYVNGAPNLISASPGGNGLVGVTLAANHLGVNFSDMDLGDAFGYDAISGVLVDQINALGTMLAAKYAAAGAVWNPI